MIRESLLLYTLSNFEIRRDVIAYLRWVTIKCVRSIWNLGKAHVLGLHTVKHTIYCRRHHGLSWNWTECSLYGTMWPISTKSIIPILSRQSTFWYSPINMSIEANRKQKEFFMGKIWSNLTIDISSLFIISAFSIFKKICSYIYGSF